MFGWTNKLARLAAVASVAVLSSCVGFQSESYDYESKAPTAQTGWQYALPTGVFLVSLYDVSGVDADDLSRTKQNDLRFAVRIEGPHFWPDATQSYRLVLDDAPMHSESAGVFYYPGTTFLKEIRFTSSSQLDEAIHAGAKAAQKLAGPRTTKRSGEEKESPIAGPIKVDLLSKQQRADAGAALQLALDRYLLRILESADCIKPALKRPVKCVQAQRMRKDIRDAVDTGRPFIAFGAEALSRPSVPVDVAPSKRSTKCHIGICYRPLRPYYITVRMGPAAPSPSVDPWRTGFVAELPNGSSVVAVKFDRPLLAERGARLTFEYPGLPATIVTNSKSDGAEAIYLPFEVASAILAIPVDEFTSGSPTAVGKVAPSADKDPNYGADKRAIKFHPDKVPTFDKLYPMRGPAFGVIGLRKAKPASTRAASAGISPPPASAAETKPAAAAEAKKDKPGDAKPETPATAGPLTPPE
ncbi:MAG: hypothetical protein MRY74_04905 [Neomegalonema sp.]|nr:hypothetical protein [Neomegalonema sp.]